MLDDLYIETKVEKDSAKDMKIKKDDKKALYLSNFLGNSNWINDEKRGRRRM